MKVLPTEIPEVLIIEPPCFQDDRGFFIISYQEQGLREQAGISLPFIQDNHSRSMRHVLRGMHYQTQHPQGKLVRVVAGEVFDVVVDVRVGSSTFGQWVGVHLSADNHRMMWVPPGFAHGFLVLSDYADFLYKVTDIYAPEYERTLAWNDPDVGINWPLSAPPVLSKKDEQGLKLQDVIKESTVCESC